MGRASEEKEMTNNNHRCINRLTAWFMAIAIFALPLGALAQGTRVVAPKNGYRVEEDVQAGQQAAMEAERQLPILNDYETTAYINRVGQRLVAAIPSEFQHPQFRYTFKVVNARDINAFALPGGPMYVNRGMMEAARSEGEMAGVMAHEISHVALRHGTAQASKAQKYSIGAAAGQILGAIVGGGVGSVIAQGSQLGIGAYFLKFSREYETQADILGAQIMARAGYDPRDLANMFQTIERQGGGRGGPEWLSSHPNPGRRYERINQEAALLRVDSRNAMQDTREFQMIQARLRSGGRAPSMAEIAQSGQRYPQDDRQRYPQDGRGGQQPQGRVEYPSTRYRTVTPTNFLRISVPDNWQGLPDNSNTSMIFAPRGAYGNMQNGQFVWTHGVQVGVDRTQSRNLQQATNEFINSLAQGNPSLRQQGGYQRGNIGGRNALAITFSNVSEVTGRTEIVTIYTTLLRNGELFYMIAVAPQDEYRDYQRTFQSILQSIQLAD